MHILLTAANLPSTTYHDHVQRQERPDKDAALKDAIREIFVGANRCYGYRRVHGDLVNAGWKVGLKKVLNLMQKMGLAAKIRRRRYSSHKGTVGVVAKNHLKRQFTATVPNEKWVTDVTEFRVDGRRVYLSPVMDLFDRQIIAYTISGSPNLELTNDALRAALATLPKDHTGLMVHSDQGYQYQHRSWQMLLTSAQALQSMSRKGNCYDNAVIESFFGHLKEEMYNHTRYQSVEELTAALHSYIVWYNTKRISGKLGYLSPVAYRAKELADAA